MLYRLFIALTITLFVNLASAQAAEVSIRKYSADDLKTACEKVGGSFTHDPGDYACSTDCKGGQGTDCSVFCKQDRNKCTAQVIGSRRPKTLEQALAPRRKAPR